ncbi:uncharacterized protein LOC141680141 [Apium graveolens]|uniref:uncharacterized protein LOC141680141 n=1 Tax=Apium graveolens TaxID=4045 RepID=UPI003D79E376
MVCNKQIKIKGKDKCISETGKKNLFEDFNDAMLFESTINDTVNKDTIMPDLNYLNDMYIDVDDLPNYHPHLWQGYMDIGPRDKMCNKCGATIWNGERNNKSCTAGGKIDNKINRGNAPYCFRLEENRLNALGCASDSVDPELVEELLAMLDKNNQLVKAFRKTRDRFENNDLDEFKLVLISSKYQAVDLTQLGHLTKLLLLFHHFFSGLGPHLAGRLWQQYIVDAFAAIEQGDSDPMHVGKAVILPASFTGSQRYMTQYFKDSLAICRAIGHRSLFLTITCNSKWPEIQKMLKYLPNVDPVDAPDVVARVFKLKVDQLMDLIKKKNYFGRCIGVMHVIEFQKRGLPRMHMLIWFHPEDRPDSVEKIDELVSAEIPDAKADPIAYKAVKNYNSRYVCTSKASWRIFGFDIHSRWPSVDRLPIHLPGEKHINFKTSADLEKVCKNATSKKTKLEAWFIANKELPQSQNFTYADFPSNFTWVPSSGRWKLRQRGDVVRRLTEVHARSGELLYLRMLLLRKKGCLLFSDLRTVDGVTYDTFKDACRALGLLNNDKQWHDAIYENSHSAMPTQLRAMFVNILVYCSVSDTLSLWNTHWQSLSDDIVYVRRKIAENIHISLSKYEIKNYALAEIEKLLNDVGKSLKDFPELPYPDEHYFGTSVNHLIVKEKGYDKEQMRVQHEKKYNNLNAK